MVLKAIIVDDERLARAELKKLLQEFPDINVIDEAANAEEGTIRKLYAASVGENAVHGSDSDENAEIEGDFFFSKLEQF